MRPGYIQKHIIIFTTIFLFHIVSALSQQKLAPGIYYFQFTDKNNTAYNLNKPEEFLSSRALLRRTKQRIPILENDLPICKIYLDSITHSGFNIVQTSKWLNAAAIQISNDSMLSLLSKMSFIRPFINSNASANHPKLIIEDLAGQPAYDTLLTPESYNLSYAQVAMHHGDSLHNFNYRGDSMLIAILDGGFAGALQFSSLQPVWNENRVILMRDMVDKTGSNFFTNSHGANVFSIIAGYQKNIFIGTAPNAKYALIRTEDAHTETIGVQFEYPVEEFYWVAGAELADSIGADIIHSSLGYSIFNDSSLSYTYKQMDGKTAISSRGAKIAATKGIIVVSSAGNEGNNSWKYITAPGDADSILTIGAISATKQIASFSSRGPTSDRRIKPDVVAIGQGAAIQSSAENFIKSNGTSFSAPVITGLTACLWQACPDKTNFEIIDAIKRSSSQYQTPDTIIGYGIPDFYKALLILRNKLAIASLQPDFNNLIISPNPFESACYIQFGPVPKSKSCIYITDIQGKILYKTDVNTNTYTRNSIACDDMGKYAKGIYFIHLISGNKHLKAKVVKQ